MDSKTKQSILDALERIRKEINTPEKAREFLYSRLGTHNRDGSLCEQYGGERTDPDHPVHVKKDG